MNKRLLIPALLLAIGAMFLYTLGLQTQNETVVKTGAPVLEVATLSLKTQRILLRHSLPGRVTALRQADVRPQVDGIVTRRLFNEGAEVAKGQQLYQIDDTRYKAELNSAVADQRSAEANLKAVEARSRRYGELLKKSAISQQDYDDAVAGLDQARAAVVVAQSKVELAQINLDYTRVHSPISGRISRSFVTEGALVTANQNQALATITVLDPVYVDMQQSADNQAVMELRTELMRNTSMPVQLRLERDNLDSTYAHVGELKFSEVTMDKTTGSTTLRAEIPNPESYLMPGMFVHAVLELGEKEVLLVPQRATARTPQGQLRVWTIDSGNSAQPRTIQAEAPYQDSWIVTDGLKPGETLIMAGYQKLQAGQQVSTVAWKGNQTTKLADTEGK
ncbi:efflux RND transporter periplasmic adaptor subunit [Pontibacter sp. JAM-7]|uniref:efflux RND transporter periplasmic adaptor subunit n=1 Tax=Pontibacter sp. JAM-7 TaxID=3366581 RepID=UPI003AF515C0